MGKIYFVDREKQKEQINYPYFNLPLNEWINILLKAMGMTKKQLSKKLNIKPQSLNSILNSMENDKNCIKTLNKLAKAMECSLFIFLQKNNLTHLETR